MGLFNLKFKKDKKIKLLLIKKIQEVEKVVSTERLYLVSNSLVKIVDMLDDSGIQIEPSEVAFINHELGDIKQFASKSYEDLLKSKCDSIIAVLKKDKDSLKNKNMRDNEQRLYKILGEQVEITNNINKINSQMEEVLGKDKNKWIMLNTKKNNLTNRLAILTKNYSTILAAQSNVEFINEIKKAKEFADSVAEEQYSVDVGQFEDDMVYVNRINQEVVDTHNQINESFAKNFLLGNEDFAYEKAMEERFLNDEKLMGDVENYTNYKDKIIV